MYDFPRTYTVYKSVSLQTMPSSKQAQLSIKVAILGRRKPPRAPNKRWLGSITTSNEKSSKPQFEYVQRTSEG